MAMPVILKGDTSARISFSLTDNFSYEGYSLRVDFHHVSYVIYDLKAGSTVSVQYTAEDTSRFPLGTGLMTLTLENEEGTRRTLPVERVKVTDAPAEVYDGAIIIDPGMAKVEDLPERFTDNDVRSKINQILSFFRRCAAFCLLGIMSYGFVAASVLTAPKGEIYNDSPVVTNVNLEGLAKTDEVPQIVTKVVNDVSETLFNNYISATNDNFVAAVNASQVSVDDSVVAEIAEYAGVDVPTAGAASIGALFIVILGGLSALKLKKQDALSQEQVVAVNSGITADKVSKLEGIEAGAQKNPDLSGYAKTDEVIPRKVEGYWETIVDGMGLHLLRTNGTETASFTPGGVNVGGTTYQDGEIYYNGQYLSLPSVSKYETFAVKSDVEKKVEWTESEASAISNIFRADTDLSDCDSVQDVAIRKLSQLLGEEIGRAHV